jgi:hypothetical protein
MGANDSAAFGIFANRANAEAAVGQLTIAGFPSRDISALLSDKSETSAFAAQNSTKAPEGATAGAAVGGVLVGALGLLAGIGALPIPGLGPLIVAGPIMVSLAGLGVGGAVGGFVGVLVGMGIPEFEAKCYESQLKEGAVLLAVHCRSLKRISKAREILEDAGAEDIAFCGNEFGDVAEDSAAVA